MLIYIYLFFFSKINLNNLNIGANSSTYKLFFYILNDTKSKIVMYAKNYNNSINKTPRSKCSPKLNNIYPFYLIHVIFLSHIFITLTFYFFPFRLDNCNLGNSFLFNVNKNIQDVNTNDYLNVLSMQYNEFNNKKEMLKFLNKIIIKCKQIKKIKIFSNYITEEETKLIAKHIIKKNIVSFEDTYDVPSSHKRNRKFSKLSKKINNIDCNTELTPNEIKKITEFFQKEQKNGINDNKHNSPLNDRYHLSDLKTKNIKNSFIKK